MSTPSDQLEEIAVTSTSKAPRPPAQQFGRKYSLIVGTDIGDAIDLSELRIKFFTRRGDLQNPNTCDVRVYNLSTKTANKIAGREFTQLQLIAGYPANYGPIFIGTISQSRIGRENQVDSYVDFTAYDGDEAYNYAPIVASLSAGANGPNEILGTVLKGMQAAAVTGSLSKGYIGKFTANPLTRGTVLYGKASDILRKLANNNDMSWSIQDQKLTMIPLSSYIPGDPVLVSPGTGLVGVPEQTQNGINIRMLLNPNVKIGQSIKLTATVNQLRLSTNAKTGDLENRSLLNSGAKINGQGLYYVMTANHFGDSRGNAWYTDVVCLAIDATLPIDGVYQNQYFVSKGPITRF